MPKEFDMVVVYVMFCLVAIVGVILGIKLAQLIKGNKQVEKELAGLQFEKLPMGTVKTLSILPLIDFYTDDPSLKTEAGVSYFIQAGDTKILMDLGFNKDKEHPSPLVSNAKKLNVSLPDLDFIFISHRHLDHIGGMKEQKTKQFSLSQGKTDLPQITVYSPTRISPSHWNPGPKVEVINTPFELVEGVASIGSIPRNLFILGHTLENSLAVNVAGKGIVLIIGCGHQTIERIIERAQALFDEPIYGIIGGLHFPVKTGRIMLGPLNIQNIVGTHRFPWQGIGEQDVKNAIQAVKQVNPQFVALSPHDSSDWSIELFRDAFQDKYHDIKVGQKISI